MRLKYLTPLQRLKHIYWLAISFIINIVLVGLLMIFDKITTDPNIFVGISALFVLISYVIYMCYLTFFSIVLISSQWRDLKYATKETRKTKHICNK